MPNTYIKPEKRVALALAMLKQRSRYLGLVTPFDGRGFVGARNDTLLYETQGVTIARDYEWRTRTAPIEWNEIAKTSLSIKIDKHLYSGNKFTDEEETLDLTSYGREILLPQMNAIVDRLDSRILSKLTGYANMKTAALAIDAGADVEGKNALRLALKIKAKADADRMPTGNRVLFAGADLYAYLVGSGMVPQADSAQALTAFRQGVFGRIAGFNVLDGTGVLPDNGFYALDQSWCVFANAAPVVPQGAAWGARQSHEGISLRVIRDYDVNYASDRSLVNTFYGLSAIEDEMKVHTTASASAAGNGFEAGDPVITDGEPELTGKNVRVLKGTFTAPVAPTTP